MLQCFLVKKSIDFESFGHERFGLIDSNRLYTYNSFGLFAAVMKPVKYWSCSIQVWTRFPKFTDSSDSLITIHRSKPFSNPEPKSTNNLWRLSRSSGAFRCVSRASRPAWWAGSGTRPCLQLQFVLHLSPGFDFQVETVPGKDVNIVYENIVHRKV